MGHDLSFDREFALGAPAVRPRSRALRAELAPGEAVAWEGGPKLGGRLVRSLFACGFGLVLFGVAAIGTAAAVERGGFFVVVTAPFLVVGAGLILSPLWAVIGATRTSYAVTDRRVILIEPSGLSLRFRSYGPDQLTRIVRTQRWDGSGNLLFQEAQGRGPDDDTAGGFLAIRDVRRVERIIRSTLLGARP